MVVAGKRLLRCAITDLSAQGFDSPDSRRLRLREQMRVWVVDRIDIVQLREKQLEGGELLALAQAAMEVLRGVAAELDASPSTQITRLLVNGRPDVAVAAGAHGVHLPARSGELTPSQVRAVYTAAGTSRGVVAVSCHTVGEVGAARKAGADLVLFGPVFEKRVAGEVVTEGTGLERLQQACVVARAMPVLALGGVTGENTVACLDRGAAGIAAIRLFDNGQVFA